MHRIPKMFSHHNSDRRAAKSKPRLDRCNARKDISYEYSPSSSDESIRTRSLDLYGGGNKTSFRIEGIDGEIEILCRNLGFSGIEDFEIPPDQYDAMMTKVRSSSAPVLFSHSVIEPVIEPAPPFVYRKSDVNCVNDCISNSNSVVVVAVDDDDLINREKVEEDCDTCVGNIDRIIRLGETSLDENVTNEYRGNGIKGVRPPVLAPPPMMSLPVIDKECSTWDMFRAFAPDSDISGSRFSRGFCLEEDEDVEDEEGGGLKRNDIEGNESRRRVVCRDENFLHSGSCSFTTNSNDDDSSSTTTELTSSVSPNRFRRVIVDWDKGDLLGRGSFGSVYEGISGDGFFFAAKEVSLLDQGDEGKQSVLQLEQEIALLSQFEHENIVQYYGTKKDGSHLYIFLELVTKGSLLSLYQKYTLKDSQVSAYTRQILHGLKYLHHKNVVHRDIKCANILVDSKGLVKLADFGLAKATKLNDVKSCKGTAFWMAPEVVRGRGYGLAADIWSLGCTVLEMLTGRFPYSNLECMAALFRIGRGERPHIPDSLSSDARDFIRSCLEVDPSLRPTAAQLLDHPFVKRPLPSSPCLPSPHYFTRQF